jgi:hypothetical protein
MAQVALPAMIDPLQAATAVLLSLNVKLPVASGGETVAVKTTVPPNVTGFELLLRLETVEPGFTI